MAKINKSVDLKREMIKKSIRYINLKKDRKAFMVTKGLSEPML